MPHARTLQHLWQGLMMLHATARPLTTEELHCAGCTSRMGVPAVLRHSPAAPMHGRSSLCWRRQEQATSLNAYEVGSNANP